MAELNPTRPDHVLVDDYITSLKQRIAELEAEVGHYKQWLKERTCELESHLEAQVQSVKLINEGAQQRIAELEDWNKELVSRLEDANKAIDVVSQSRNDWHDNSDEQAKRIAELEGFVKWVHEEGSDYWRDEASKLLEKGKK